MFANSDNGGGTDWAQKTVPQMWSMLAAHDGTAHKDLLLTWLQSADLLIDHLSRVKRYRDNLAEAWPPEKSKAAAKYLDRLDELIGHLTSTYYAAVENHRALGAATSALVGARIKLESIYRAYLANQQDMNAYAAKLRTNEQIVGKYRIIAPTPPTAAESRQLELQLEAQSVMSALSTDLAQAQLAITTPKSYIPYGKYDETEPFDPAGNTPPSGKSLPTNSPTLRSTSSGSSASNRQTPPVPGSDHGTVPTPQYPESSPPQQPGPILSGMIPPTTEPATLPPESHSINNGGNISNHPISPLPSSRFSDLTPRTISARPPALPAQETDTRNLRGSANPLNGGIIGGLPPAGSTQPRANLPKARQVNPAGGIIGGPPSAPGGRAGSSRSSNSDDNKKVSNHWDPEDPWATDSGVDPVLLPPEKKTIDPGPAIGLP